MTLTFKVREDIEAAFAEGVMAALEQLGYDFEYDEHAPADADGLCTYTVAKVAKMTEPIEA